MRERLQKLLARAGVASRRTAEKLIEAGAVRVNGRVVTKLGTKADPATDTIEVEGRTLAFPEKDVYLLMNKPRGAVTTAYDPKGRRTIFSLLRGLRQRVFPVGRLPYDVEGLLILTSNGAFADFLLRGCLPQTYHLKIKGRLESRERERLAQAAACHQVEPLGLRLQKRGPNPWYEVTLVAPREDWLQTWLLRLGHPVEKVKRVAFGSLYDPKLPPGQYRELNQAEIDRLKSEARRTSGGGHRRRAG